MATIEVWDPNDWEDYVFKLLQDRHGPLNIAKAPARHKGDLGLDYYSLMDQVVYQCYAVQEPVDVASRAKKQAMKMSADIKKFRTRNSQLSALFGDTKIRRWVLLVPLHDSVQVNAHATARTLEVKKLALSYVTSDFEVMIQDQSHFDHTSIEARALERQAVAIQFEKASEQQIKEWSEAENRLVAALTRKLRKRVAAGDHQDDVTEAIRWFLERENALDNLRRNAPQLHEAIMDAISRSTRRLRLLGLQPNGSPREILREELRALINILKGNVPNLTDASAEQVALGTVADWLMRCPLDFPPYDHVS